MLLAAQSPSKLRRYGVTGKRSGIGVADQRMPPIPASKGRSPRPVQLEDRREFPCQILNMSLGGLALIVPACDRLGERVVAYVDPCRPA